jgi:hypothetical protein
MLKSLSIAVLSALSLAPVTQAQSYIGAGVVFGDNQSEEAIVGRYDLPGFPVSIRAQYTSFQNPEAALGATYDSSFGAYIGGGAVTNINEDAGILTADEDTRAFVQVGYERFVGQTVVGLDYKRTISDDTYALTGFVGLTF